MLRAAREGLCAGMLTGSGPRKMVFSVLAEARDVPRHRHRRVVINMASVRNSYCWVWQQSIKSEAEAEADEVEVEQQRASLSLAVWHSVQCGWRIFTCQAQGGGRLLCSPLSFPRSCRGSIPRKAGVGWPENPLWRHPHHENRPRCLTWTLSSTGQFWGSKPSNHFPRRQEHDTRSSQRRQGHVPALWTSTMILRGHLCQPG